MPLASFFTLHWYGPGMAGAAVGVSSATAVLNMRGVGRMSLVGAATPAAVLGLVATRTMSLVSTASSSANLSMKGVGRMALVGKVNELTQDDVTGAVLEAPIEGGLSLKQTLRILLAHAAGDATGLESANQVFKSQDGTKDRIVGTYSAGTRNVTSIDGT